MVVGRARQISGVGDLYPSPLAPSSNTQQKKAAIFFFFFFPVSLQQGSFPASPLARSPRGITPTSIPTARKDRQSSVAAMVRCDGSSSCLRRDSREGGRAGVGLQSQGKVTSVEPRQNFKSVISFCLTPLPLRWMALCSAPSQQYLGG